MNIQINSQTLAAELRLLSKVVPSRPSLPVLKSIRFHAEDKLILSATDLDVGLVSTCAATVLAPGEVALPSATLAALVEQFSDEDVSIVQDSAHVVVRCGKFKTRLQVQPVADFPVLPTEDGTISVLNGPALVEAIKKVRYAISDTGSRLMLQGALLALAGKTATLAATDGHRLAVVTMPHENEGEARVLIPVKTLDLLAVPAGDVTMTVGERHLFFRTGERLLISRTLEGTFPPYEKIIPRTNDKTMAINRYALTSALRRVSLVSGDSEAITLDIAEGELTLSSSSAEVGAADEVIAMHYSGAPVQFRMNGSYLLDFVTAATAQTIALAVKDATTAMLLRDGEQSTGVVMGMRL